MPREPKPELEVAPFASREAWGEWLALHGATAPGLWVKFAKKDSGIPSITYDEALEEALRHGWIDGQKKSFDADFYLLRFTPRAPRSNWSRINREKAERLIAQGRMTPSGLKHVESARADGRWDRAYDSPSRMAVPDDLRERLDASPAARSAFEGLDSANRYAVLYRIHEAKRSETRATRIDRFVAMLERGETIHPRPARPAKNAGE